MSAVPIEPAQAADLPAVLNLLERHGLPRDGAADTLDAMVVVRSENRIIGVAALEFYDDGALLRSVAVETAAQGAGVGRRLVARALEIAAERGYSSIFLLTTTAEHYFAQFGFTTIGRAEAPASVRASVEFRSACPESAAVMRCRRNLP